MLACPTFSVFIDTFVQVCTSRYFIIENRELIFFCFVTLQRAYADAPPPQ